MPILFLYIGATGQAVVPGSRQLLNDVLMRNVSELCSARCLTSLAIPRGLIELLIAI